MASSSDKVSREIQEALDRLLDTGHTWVGTIEGTEGSVKASITDAQDTVATVTFPLPAAADPLDTFTSGLAAWMSSSDRPLERGQEVLCDSPAAVFHGVERSGMLQLVHHFWELSVQEVGGGDEPSGVWLTEEEIGEMYRRAVEEGKDWSEETALRQDLEEYFSRYLTPEKQHPMAMLEGLHSGEEELERLGVPVRKHMNLLWIPRHARDVFWLRKDTKELVGLLKSIDGLSATSPLTLTIFVSSGKRNVDSSMIAFVQKDLETSFRAATWKKEMLQEGGVTFQATGLTITLKRLKQLSLFQGVQLHYVAWLGEPKEDMKQLLEWQQGINLRVFNDTTETWETPSPVQ